jgi:glutamine synthetase
MDKQRDFVLRTIEERGIKFVRLWFTDVTGTLKSVAIAPAEVEGAFAEGLGFDGSAIEGLTRSYEADMLAHPDPTTFQILPWRGEIDPTARMFCDISTPDGQPAIADPRNVLKRTLEKAADRGFTFYTHPEIEFYLLKSSEFGGGRGPPPPPPPPRGTSTTSPAVRRTTSAAARCACWKTSASQSSSATMRRVPARTRSTCATRTRSPRRTTS